MTVAREDRLIYSAGQYPSPGDPEKDQRIMPTETFEFQVEARQLLQLMIHSIYSNKDVFLRELVSNASDALDKLRLEALRDDALGADVSDLHIEIETDPGGPHADRAGQRHRHVARRGRSQLIGTIANSGTAAVPAGTEGGRGRAPRREGLIGQFGVGFYSSFMVADEVTLLTRRAGESQGTRWASARRGHVHGGDRSTTRRRAPPSTLRLKPEDSEDQLHDYTSPWKIREIVKRYSDFITWPIRMAARAGGRTAEATRTARSRRRRRPSPRRSTR